MTAHHEEILSWLRALKSFAAYEGELQKISPAPFSLMVDAIIQELERKDAMEDFLIERRDYYIFCLEVARDGFNLAVRNNQFDDARHYATKIDKYEKLRDLHTNLLIGKPASQCVKKEAS